MDTKITFLLVITLSMLAYAAFTTVKLFLPRANK